MSWSRYVAGPGSYRLTGAPPQPIDVPGVPGLVLADVWRTEGVPVSNSAAADLATQGSFAIAPDAEGTVFRVITFPPKSVLDKADPGLLARMGAETPAGSDSHLMWHQTASIDYISIVSGAIDLVTEVDRISLRSGDVAVVRGILHAWDNPAEEVCVMTCVSIGST
ncbi:MAG TPA: hypothetical protein VK934_11655 [Fimbriimonas sp.]|nr:hypothetical protein [Fimbriimonas sp.]